MVEPIALENEELRVVPSTWEKSIDFLNPKKTSKDEHWPLLLLSEYLSLHT